MTILDSFFILFKTNAGDVKKQTTEAKKSVDEFEKQINQSDKATRNLATSLLELGTTAIASYASFEGIKTGIKDAIDFNLLLDKQEKLTGAAGHELAAYDATFQQFGANRGEFLNWFSQYAAYLQQTGGNVQQIIPNLRQLADEIHNLPDGQARQFFQQIAQAYGLPQSFYLSLRQGSAGIDELLAKNQQLITANQKSEKIARDFEQAWEGAGIGIQGAWTDLENVVLPFLTRLLNFLSTPLKIPDWLAAFIPDFFLKKVSSTSGIPSLAGGRAPLGIRSNNPGNIQPGGREAVFASPQQGITAEKDLLKRYGASGTNTLSAIASRWSGLLGSEAASYANGLSQSTGYGLNTPLNFNDPSVLANVANAINKQENGAAYGNLIGGGGTGGGNMVNIDSINIQTQATDASGIAAAIDDKLNQHFRTTVSNWDDGVSR